MYQLSSIPESNRGNIIFVIMSLIIKLNLHALKLVKMIDIDDTNHNDDMAILYVDNDEDS